MKDLSDWLLLERELDQSFRSAAASFYENVFNATVAKAKYAVDNFVKGFDMRFPKQTPLKPENTMLLASTLSFSFAGDAVNNFKFDGAVKQKWMRIVLYTSPTALPYPAPIAKQAAEGWLKGVRMFEMIITGMRSAGTSATYITGRKITKTANVSIVSYPTINVYGLETLRVEPGKPLHDAMLAIINMRNDGNLTKRRMRAELNEWLKKFTAEMRSKRQTMVHEYIHFLDDIRYKEDSHHPGNILKGMHAADDPEDKMKVAYYTSDAEWNSHYQAGADTIENAVRNFLIAATSEVAETTARTMTPGFNSLPPKEKSRKVADVVIADLKRKVNGVVTSTWAKSHMKAQGIENTGFRGAGLLALLGITYHAYSTSKHFLADPKRKMKLMNRISSLQGDLIKIVDDYRRDMYAGKTPTQKQFENAMDEYDQNIDRRVLFDIYKELFTGLMMGKKVFSTKGK